MGGRVPRVLLARPGRAAVRCPGGWRLSGERVAVRSTPACRQCGRLSDPLLRGHHRTQAAPLPSLLPGREAQFGEVGPPPPAALCRGRVLAVQACTPVRLRELRSHSRRQALAQGLVRVSGSGGRHADGAPGGDQVHSPRQLQRPVRSRLAGAAEPQGLSRPPPHRRARGACCFGHSVAQQSKRPTRCLDLFPSLSPNARVSDPKPT